MKKRLLAAAALCVCAFILDRVFSGHNYIAYAMYLGAVLTVVLSLAGKVLKRFICIGLALCLAYLAVVEVPIIKSASGDTAYDADYIIVLGAAVHGDTPSLSLLERMEAAKDYLIEHPDTVAIVSGGQGGGENLSEAQAMYNWLSENGIEANRLIMENKATSTYENLKFSFEIIDSLSSGDSPKIAVVTSEYHIYRAKLIAGSLGTEVHAIAAHTTYPTVRLNYFIREAFGVTYQIIFG